MTIILSSDVATAHLEIKRQSLTFKTITLVFSAVLGLTSFFASARLFCSELMIPPDLRLSELRLFNPERNFQEPIVGSLFSVIDSVIEDGNAIHTSFALCFARFKRALRAGDRLGVKAARAHCLAEVEKGLRRTPANGRLWLEKANLLFQSGDSSEAFVQAIRASFLTARREGWLMPARLVVVSRAWSSLPEHIRNQATQDVSMMLASDSIVNALVGVYVERPNQRQAIGEMVERLDQRQQERFVHLVRLAVGSEN